jgi:enoyl-CoA hydratase
VLRKLTGRVARITLARPERRNALSFELLGQLEEALNGFSADPEVRVIVLDHDGDVFCAGGDLTELSGTCTPEGAESLRAIGTRVLQAFALSPKPIVAALSGPAIGGGAELAIACDFRLMGSNARIEFKHLRLAATPAWGSVARLTQLLGGARATTALMRAQSINATEAQALGLAHAFESTLVEDLAAMPPFAVTQLKAALRGTATEEDAFLRSWASNEHRELMEGLPSR